MTDWTATPVFLDFETQSAADLKEVGGRLYAAHESTRVLSCVVLVGDVYHVWVPDHIVIAPYLFPTEATLRARLKMPQPKGIHIHRGAEFPDLPEAFYTSPLCAHNAYGFDRFIAERCGTFHMPRVGVQWVDTLPLARIAGLPGSLEELAKRFFARGKHEGGRFVKVACKVKTDKNGEPLRDANGKIIYPEVGGGTLEQILVYNIEDVYLLSQVWERLAEVEVEADVIDAHNAINDRGVYVDVPLVNKIKSVAQVSMSKAAGRIHELTGGELGAHNLRSTVQVNAWLAARGVRIRDANGKTTLRKDQVEQALANPWMMVDDTGEEDDTNPAEAAASIDPTVFEVLRLRNAALRITSAKADRAVFRVGPDGRARDLFTFHTAHTGRWSSTGIQVHNLPRPKKGVPVAELLELHESGAWQEDRGGEAWDAIRAILPAKLDVDDALSALLRPMFRAAPGHVLAVADYSQVECRGLAWIADEQSLIADLLSGDVYRRMAAKLFGKPVEAVTDTERQIGKVVVLGCIAEGSPVLTERGWVPIERVELTDRVWDGVEFVSHCGLQYKGVRDTICISGVWMTPDHEVLTETGWVQACRLRESIHRRPPGTLGENGQFSTLYVGHGVESSPYSAVVVAGRNTPSTPITSLVGSPPDATRAPGGRVEILKPYTRTSSPTVITANGCSTASAQSSGGVQTPLADTGLTTAGGGLPSPPSGSPTAGCSSLISPPCPAGTTPDWRSIAGTTPAGTNPETFGLQPDGSKLSTPAGTGSWNSGGSACPSLTSYVDSCRSTDPLTSSTGLYDWGPTLKLSSTRSTAKKVYDIALAGPRNRFQVGPLIAHNCGYGLGVDRFRIYAGLSGVDLAAAGTTAEACVDGYRKAYPRIAGSYAGQIDGRAYRTGGVWSQLDKAAKLAVQGEGLQKAGRCSWWMDNGDLVCTLPSGRRLRYPNARIEEKLPGYARHVGDGRTKATVVYDSDRGERSLYGGKITENVVQALCRDLFATAIVRCEGAGLPVVLHGHDEIVCEVPADGPADPRAVAARDALLAIMTEVPPWATGFPVAAEGFVTDRYLKDAPAGWPRKVKR